MADYYADRVVEGSATTGTGTLTLDGVSPTPPSGPNYRTFSAAGVPDASVVVFLTSLNTEWEISRGTYTVTGTTLTRALLSSSTGSLINWGAGTKTVSLLLSASGIAQFAKNDVAQSFAGRQTFVETAETGYNLTGTVISAANGGLQYKTLTANTTFTESLVNGQSVTLLIDDGTAYTVTWPTLTWIDGPAPTLATTGYTVVVLFKVNGVLYARSAGST